MFVELLVTQLTSLRTTPTTARKLLEIQHNFIADTCRHSAGKSWTNFLTFLLYDKVRIGFWSKYLATNHATEKGWHFSAFIHGEKKVPLQSLQLLTVDGNWSLGVGRWIFASWYPTRNIQWWSDPVAKASMEIGNWVLDIRYSWGKIQHSTLYPFKP